MVALRSYLTASCHFGLKKLFGNLRTGVSFSKALIFQLIFIVGHMMSESMLLSVPSMLSYPAKKKKKNGFLKFKLHFCLQIAAKVLVWYFLCGLGSVRSTSVASGLGALGTPRQDLAGH